MLLSVTAFSACVRPVSTSNPTPAVSVSPPPTALLRIEFLKKVAITKDTEGGGARPEIVATGDRVFVLYLGDIAAGTSRSFKVKVLDRDLTRTFTSKSLVSTTTEYGGPTDIRVASDGQYLYAFYETHKPTSAIAGTTYLWGAKYTLNDSFERLGHTDTPIASSKPMVELPDGGELLDDPAPLVGPDSVFVVTRLKYSLSTAGRTAYRVREFDKDLTTMLREFDLDLSSAADGRARVASLLFYKDAIYIALATTVSDQEINDKNDDGALSDIILVKLRPDWTIDPQEGVWPLASEPGDRENYVTGLATDGEFFYLAYKQAAGRPPTGEQRAWLRIYGKDFSVVGAETVKSVAWGPSGGEIRPSLEVSGNRIYSGQSSGQGIGRGNAEIYIYDLTK